ncbi:MAG: peroxidase family protein, partial [Gammaproteobacteria bacterium]|nr:peroxidase family protein [Gammaproteobacteria bacterium]
MKQSPPIAVRIVAQPAPDTVFAQIEPGPVFDAHHRAARAARSKASMPVHRAWPWPLLLLLLGCAPGLGAVEIRSIDGSGNNQVAPDWGSSGSELLRLTPAAYADAVDEPRGGLVSSLPSARAVSNSVAVQATSAPNASDATDWLWQWGQFLDHDLSHTRPSSPAQPFDIPVPADDTLFDPLATGTARIGLSRSESSAASGVREQINSVTAYIDASQIYGSDAARAAVLRDSGNDGKMKMGSAVNGEATLVFNTFGLDNDGGGGDTFYVSGDVRVNEQIGLIAAHTLFSREHNRIADTLKARLQGGDADLIARRDQAIAEIGNGIDSEDDFLYQSARRVVGAEIQQVTYQEFLPVLLGQNALSAYAGYDDTSDAGIANEFSTAAYRIGHSLLSSELLRVDNGDNLVESVSLRDAFFDPQSVHQSGVDTLFKGLASQAAQALDTQVVDDVRNFLF